MTSSGAGFTGKERDAETGLDYFGARYLSGAQGRFTSPDPYNIITEAENRKHFETYIGEPRNWNRYAYVWNNPLRHTDPTGETVYVVTYVYGNHSGDDAFARAAETRANEIRNSKGFDPKKDIVLTRGVDSFAAFASVIKEANGLEKTFGKVGEVSIFSHAGLDGPNFNAGLRREGYTNEQKPLGIFALKINWDSSAQAGFYGCRTAVPNPNWGGASFAQAFANIQGVPTYGFDDETSFSGLPASKDKSYVFGVGQGIYLVTQRDGRPPVRKDPTRPTR